jgi:hypothetical protein
MLDAIFESTVFRLCRLFQTFSTYIIEPAMITTADAGVFDSAEFQGGPAMRTVEA